jgi:hypothetical protein
MKIEAWPFLVGRNRTLGYQTIVSPQFLSEEGLSMLLAEAAGGDESGPENAIYREILRSKGEDFSLIFRVVRAKARDYELGGDEALKDRGGRSIRLIEGFVVRGRKRTLQVTYSDLQTVHNLVKEAYRKFWDANDTFKEIASRPVSLPTENHSSEQVQLIKEKPLDLRPPLNVRRLVLVALIALILLITGGIVILNNVPPPLSPDQLLSTFCSDLQMAKPDYSDAYNQLSSGIQPPLTESRFAAFFTKHPVKSCSHHVNTIAGNSAAATLMITYQDGVLVPPLTITLQKEQNYVIFFQWKITTNIASELQQNNT